MLAETCMGLGVRVRVALNLTPEYQRRLMHHSLYRKDEQEVKFQIVKRYFKVSVADPDIDQGEFTMCARRTTG